MLTEVQKKQNEQVIAFCATLAKAFAGQAINATLAFLGLGAAFLLWRTALEAPSPSQLVGLGLFASFVLGLLYIRRLK